MSSIDANQPEQNRDHLYGVEAIERIREMVKDAESCFFCTSSATAETGGVRPMSVQKADDQGHLWFLSPSDSAKNAELAKDPSVKLFFQASKHAGFLALTGTARISRDRARIKDLWQPVLKTWFTEGEDDPRITVVEVVPTGGYYWDNKHGNLVAATKMMIGAATGTTLDDSIQGTLQP